MSAGIAGLCAIRDWRNFVKENIEVPRKNQSALYGNYSSSI